MLDRESRLPWDWFARGDQDLQAAVILLNQDGPLEIVAFHIQQAMTKPESELPSPEGKYRRRNEPYGQNHH